ncbi:MAG: hypothetical protein ACI39W_02515 [Brotaphodocola sp.]
MAEHKKITVGTAAVLAVGITGYSAWKQLVTGVLSWHIRQPEFISMMTELLVIWLIFILAFFVISKSQKKMIGWGIAGLSLLAFFWLHKLMLPVLFTGAYTGYLILTGFWFTRFFLRKEFDLAWDFLMGSAVTIMTFCFLSLLHLGSITKLRAWVLISGCLLAGWFLKELHRKKRAGEKCSGMDIPAADSLIPMVMLASIVTLILLQAGRMNLAVDFDSIWYGLRSDVMLDSGSGIYEDLKTLGVVYTYSKGFETLLLPLAGLPSYSFTIAMNLWIAVLLLYAAYHTAKECLSSEQALWVPFIMAAVPGIMNMADTAKADLMTVFCQLLMVQSVIFCINGRGIKEKAGNPNGSADWLVAGMAAGGVSLALKPTAMIYSPAIVGVSMLWMVYDFCGHKKQMREQEKPRIKLGDYRILLILIPSGLALAGIWGRTWKLVGVPVTSIFYGVFQKLGFQVNYPFYASGFPSAGSAGNLSEQAMFLVRRLYQLLLDPQGEDMAHVIIAWGTVLPAVLFVLWIFLRKSAKKDDRIPVKISSYLMWLLVSIGLINLVSLYSLSQIDGNYYMLYYVLMILSAVIWLGRQGGEIQKQCHRILLPVWLYGVLFCGLTNWSWTLGNGGMDLLNRGYYPHQEIERQKRAEQGSEEIWNIVAANPRNRLIALGKVPDVLTFPCWVQSYVDVSGYWGNPEVVASAPAFLNYLHFADVDYLYMEREYIDSSVRIYQIIRSLVENGWLYDVRSENGNLILSVRKPMEEQSISMISPGEKMENLSVFDEEYMQHP